MPLGWLKGYFPKAQANFLITRRVPSTSAENSLRPCGQKQVHSNANDFATKPTACALSSGDGWPTTQPQPSTNQTVNVILFGDLGVGRSAVVNLIAQREVAKVSSDTSPCTLQTSRYDITFDGIDFRIFDTVGIEATRISSNNYVTALTKGFKLITELSAAGGVHLLVFVMRGGRISGTMQRNYLLFSKIVCQTKVPTALVVTCLEEESRMEDWWTRNKISIASYGIKSDGHACVTAVFDDTPGANLKYVESQRIIRELLKDCYLKGNGFLPDVHSWITSLGKGLQLFMKGKRDTGRVDVVKMLMDNCKLDLNTARKLADRMEFRNLRRDEGNQRTGNDEGREETDSDAELQKIGTTASICITNEPDTLMGDIKSQFSHDLTGRVKRSDDFPFASGSYGDIYRGIFNLHDRSIQVAIKTCRIHTYRDEDINEKIKRLHREIDVWTTLNHPNVLSLLGTIRDHNLNPKIPAIVCPWVENGALSAYLEKNKELTFSRRLSLVNEVAHGLRYLHSKQVVHGDLSGSNVLVRADGSACIADFGLSALLARIEGSRYPTTCRNAVPVRWIAPELLDLGESRAIPNMRSDVYSLGCLMLQILTGDIPYHYFIRDAQVVMAIVTGEKPRRPCQTAITDNMWQFMEWCWSPAKLRPSSDQVIEFTKQELLESMAGDVVISCTNEL